MVSVAQTLPHGCTGASPMPAKVALTDRKLKSLAPAADGSRYEVMDSVVPGFGVRVTPNGKRTFILIGRFGGSKNPTRRALGEYGALSLEKAREKARKWIELNQGGIDPKVEEERSRRLQLAKQRTSFARVAEEFLKRHVRGQRTARATERDIRKVLIERWGARPVTEITRGDVIELIEEIADRPAPYYAHLVLGHLRTLFNWAIARGSYGLEVSPCDRLKPSTLIAPKQPRQRTLTDAEIVAFWRATERMEYPYGPLCQLMLLTGARKSEVAGARRREFDLKKKLWSIPPERFKSNATHLVPLTNQAISIIEELPELNKGDYLFSTTLGERPVTAFANAKERLDSFVTEELGQALPPFVLHDLRRTVRTRLASLRVSDLVAEMIIGHGRRGLQRVYDQHSYEPEMREALELWSARLMSVIAPPPENVVALKNKGV